MRKRLEGKVSRSLPPSTSFRLTIRIVGPTNDQGQQTPTQTTLIMCNSHSTCTLLTQYLNTLDRSKDSHTRPSRMMTQKLKSFIYLREVERLASLTASGNNKSPSKGGVGGGRGSPTKIIDVDDGISEALKKKDRDKAFRAGNRRRVRGGAPVAPVSDRVGDRVGEGSGSGDM